MEELTYDQRRKRFLDGLTDLCIAYDLMLEINEDNDLCVFDENGDNPPFYPYVKNGAWVN